MGAIKNISVRVGGTGHLSASDRALQRAQRQHLRQLAEKLRELPDAERAAFTKSWMAKAPGAKAAKAGK